MLDQVVAPQRLPARAACYVRMSTEHQQYSIDNQSDVIAKYAQSHEMEVVKTYTDAGRSGLTFQKRDGLQQLLADVESGSGAFGVILVYDVSRWGRFQDADESAYYEYRCKRAKVDVHYCAEVFENDDSLSSTLLKSLKRAMAGEYSRELSAKVFAGKCRLVEKGFHQGGHAGFGLRRLLQDQDGKPKGFLKYREIKSIFTDRVILVPGPHEEIQIVLEIFQRFADGHDSPGVIASDLNKRGIVTELGRPWTRFVVRDIVTNPKYIGANVYNRTSFRLQKAHVVNPPDMWIRRDDAFEPIVPMELFLRAQVAVATRNHFYTDTELLDRLRDLLASSGKLTCALIDTAWGMPSKTIYWERFGGLLEAYKRIGYGAHDDYSHFVIRPRLQAFAKAQLLLLTEALTKVGGTIRHETENDLIINEEFTLRFLLVRCRNTKHRRARWMFRLASPRPDITVVVRMDQTNQSVLDYYFFPSGPQIRPEVDLGLDNSYFVDVYRHADLSLLTKLARRTEVHHEQSAY